MKIDSISDYKAKPSFGILKFENNILKYDKAVNIVKQNENMQKLVQSFDHKGIDVSVKLSEKDCEEYLLLNDVIRHTVPLVFHAKKIFAELSFFNKLGKYVDKVDEPLEVFINDDLFFVDHLAIIDKFEKKNVYH